MLASQPVESSTPGAKDVTDDLAMETVRISSNPNWSVTEVMPPAIMWLINLNLSQFITLRALAMCGICTAWCDLFREAFGGDVLISVQTHV